jgi:hypothetical protein
MPFRPSRTAPRPSRGPAPIHRGPQAVNHPAGGSPIHHAPNAALLIDFDNVTMGIRSDLQTELKNLLASTSSRERSPFSARMRLATLSAVHRAARRIVDRHDLGAGLRLREEERDRHSPRDRRARARVHSTEIGTFILLSAIPISRVLVIKLKEYGKYVIGVGIRESSSDLLVMNCDEYYSYNALAGLVKSGDEEVVKHDPWELVGEAVQKMKRNGDVMRADRLKQVMQQMDPTFDEKNVGKSKFSLFVTEAAKKGLLSLTKLENGQFEVDLPKEADQAAPTPVVAAVTPPAENGDARPPRRDSRGRGRGRDRGRPPRAEKTAACKLQRLRLQLRSRNQLPLHRLKSARAGCDSRALRLRSRKACSCFTRER